MTVPCDTHSSISVMFVVKAVSSTMQWSAWFVVILVVVVED